MTKKSYAQDIATTIWNQIMATAPNIGAVMAWGVEGRAYGVTEDKEKNPYLMLKVLGNKFTGTIRIVYHQCPDVYSIHFYDRRMNEIEPLQKGMIYCDQLFDVLDGEIELPWR